MSNLRDFDLDPNDPLYYAPRHLRRPTDTNPDQVRESNFEPRYEEPAMFRHDPAPEQVTPSPSSPSVLRHRSKVFEDAVSRALRDSLEPQEIYTPTMDSGRSGFGVFLRFAVALGIVGAIALIFVVIVPLVRGPAPNAETVADSDSIWMQVKSAILPSPPRKAVASTLQFADQVGETNDTLPVGISVNAPPPGGVVILSGLPAGSRLSAGKKLSANDWRIPAQDLAVTKVTPPDEFAGQVTVNAELRNAEGAALVGGSFRMTWSRPAGQVAALSPPRTAPAAIPPQAAIPQLGAATIAPPPVSAPVPQPVVSAPPDRTMDPNEIASLIRRAQEFTAAGDIAPARLMLRRAAEAHSVQAAMMLAESYDPILLKQTASGPLPDISMARKWYGKAAEWGAPDAPRRLNALQAY